MAKTTKPEWPVTRLGQACREVTLSGRLTRLAGEAEVSGFPCTAEHLRHLAGFVLDEAAAKYSGGLPRLGDGEPGMA
jgi:hypothetical protein